MMTTAWRIFRWQDQSCDNSQGAGRHRRRHLRRAGAWAPADRAGHRHAAATKPRLAMNSGVPLAVWLTTIGGFLAIVAFDLLVVARKRSQVRPRSAIGWLAGYITL